MADKIGYMPFPEFFSTGNNSNYCSISGVFSVLGAPRKVIDTVLESSTHGICHHRICHHRICDFPNFSVWCNISKDCSISGVFSALGAPRKVVDTIFESS